MMHDMCNGEKKKKKIQHIETINFLPNPRCDQLVSGPISISSSHTLVSQLSSSRKS